MCSVCGVNICTAELIKSNNNPRNKIEQNKSFLSLSEIRNLSRTMNSESLNNLGLNESLELELARLQRLGLIKTSLVIDKDVTLNKSNEIIVFRILQEFIVNILKHAVKPT